PTAMFAIAIPMYGLFELSIVLSRMVYRWREGRDARDDSGPGDPPASPASPRPPSAPPPPTRDVPLRLGEPT
ncbi:MAG: hypothetical protein ACHQQP_09010, partial [Gemmatimonadales bacterium]